METQWLNDTSLPNDVEVLAISTAVDEDRSNFPPSDWFANDGFSGTVVVDDASQTLMTTFGGGGFPYWVAVDGEGRVVERVAGAITPEKLDDILSKITG